MTENDRKKDIKDVAKQILIVAKGINSLCVNDEERKTIALKVMEKSTTSEIDNLIEILAMTDITSPKYLIDRAVEKTVTEAKRLWAELGDIPINEDEEIDIDWHIFSKGTDRQEIWHWFENEFDLSVADDLMGMKNYLTP